VPKGKKLPPDIVNYWPEIFNDVTIESVPVEYLHSVKITFDDGKVWEIDTARNPEGVSIDEAIQALMDEYEDVIVNVDFRLDTERVKEDITRRTKLFMKKRK